MGYKIESDFTHEGLRCVVVMTDMGHRCGYVGIDNTHPLYKVEYWQKVSCLRTNGMQDIHTESAGIGQLLSAMVGECKKEVISPEMFFTVHGGITFSDGAPSKYPVESDLWWFGYDCAHACDAKDINAIESDSMREFYRDHNYGTIRTLEYCEQECRRLAEQLKKVAS